MFRGRVSPLCACVISLAALAAGASGGSLTRPLDDVVLDVELSREKREAFKTSLEDATGFPVLGYQSTRDSTGIHIAPTLSPFDSYSTSLDTPVPPRADYFKRLRSRGPIETVHKTELSFEFPTLDVKVLNNGKDTLLFTEAHLDVALSKADLSPVLFVESDYDQIQKLVLRNEGWGRIERGLIRFNLQPVGSPPRHGKYRFERKLGPFETTCDVLVSKELEALGVDAGFLAGETVLQNPPARLDQALGPLRSLRKTDPEEMVIPSRSVAISGEIVLEWRDSEARPQKSTVKFQGQVLVTPPDGLGAVGPMTGTYDAMLDHDRSNYVVRVPLTQTAKAGGMTRFSLALGFPRSAHHELTIRLGTADGRTVSSPRITLDGVLTRTCVEALASAKEAADAERAEASASPAQPSPAVEPSAATSPPPLPSPSPRHGDQP